MGEPLGLFDVDPEQVRSQQADETTRAERRRARHLAAIRSGSHPLGVALGTVIPLHPDARRDGTREPDGTPRCGDCRHRRKVHGGNRSYPKCTFGRFTLADRATHGEATDVARWWPACASYEAKEPAHA